MENFEDTNYNEEDILEAASRGLRLPDAETADSDMEEYEKFSTATPRMPEEFADAPHGTIREALKAGMQVDDDDDIQEAVTKADEDVILGEVLDKKYNELVTVQPVKFASFDNDEDVVGPPRKNFDITQDINLRVTVELGRTKMKVRKLLDITKGSIIEIDKIAGEQAEFFVCGKLIGRGEVIVIDEKFGLRITSIVEQKNT